MSPPLVRPSSERPARARFAAAMCASLLFLARAARAFTGDPDPDRISVALPSFLPAARGEIPPGARAIRSAPTWGPPTLAWQSFAARHGAWSGLTASTATAPHRAAGPPIALSGFTGRPDAVDRAVRGFVAAEPGLFGAPELETIEVVKAGRVWHARYRQRVDGLPVWFTDWEFRLSERGELMAFGADALRLAPTRDAGPPITPEAAREAALSGMPPDPARRVSGGAEECLVPLATGRDAVELRRARIVAVESDAPIARWLVLVDAETGAVLWRHDRVCRFVSGTVSAAVHARAPHEPVQLLPLPHLDVAVGAQAARTDALGRYRAKAFGATPVSAGLQGPFCDVETHARNDAVFSGEALNPATLDIVWDDALAEPQERDAYYHVNVAHDWIVGLDPAVDSLDYAMRCWVDVPGAACNALWDGRQLHFFAAGGGCVDMATVPDVVYHEYGHAINDRFYLQRGYVYGMLSQTLHEGLADAVAAFIQDDPLIGDGLAGPGTYGRSLLDLRRWPEDDSIDPHLTGMIVAGALWELRQAIGLEETERLLQLARYGHPDHTDAGQAMSELFVELLVADDDDGDLSNGTPHVLPIVEAFNRRGVGTNFMIEIVHTPSEYDGSPGPFRIEAIVTSGAPVGALDPASVLVRYSVNGGPFVVEPMADIGDGRTFRANVHAPPAALVRYTIEAGTTFGDRQVQPWLQGRYHQLLTGLSTSLLYDPFEGYEGGWRSGAVGDGAVTGRWVQEISVGTNYRGYQIQPDFNHTSWGNMCWATGNAHPRATVTTNDVDGGRTSLTSGEFDGLPEGYSRVAVEYYRWFSNGLEGPNHDDYWRALLSNDGGFTWVPVESTTQDDNSWRRVVFFIEDYLTPTHTMRMRFTVRDSLAPNVVEAALDDFQVYGFPPVQALDAQEGRPAPALALETPVPNPSLGAARIRYSLPAAGEARLVVYDLSGRAVRTLAQGRLAAGPHEVAWDGRGANGRLCPPGAYFLRLVAAERELVRKLVRIE